MESIDLNCDMGEGIGHDAALLFSVTSANIACGAHAGDEAVMRETVRAAVRKGVAIGAHPGYEDRANFGRREMNLSPDHLRAQIEEQLLTLSEIVQNEGGIMTHVKPHGALYNQAALDGGIAETIAETVHDFDPSLYLVGLAGSELIAAGRRAGLRVAREGFADRSYRPDGTLTPRSEPGALITDPEIAARRALKMASSARVLSDDGPEIALEIDTICIHGDSPGAPVLARQLRVALTEAGIEVRPFSPG